MSRISASGSFGTYFPDEIRFWVSYEKKKGSIGEPATFRAWVRACGGGGVGQGEAMGNNSLTVGDSILQSPHLISSAYSLGHCENTNLNTT